MAATNKNLSTKEVFGVTTRIEILKKSLDKKQKEFNKRLAIHLETVRESNGQPLNDKGNGLQTVNRWEKQNDTLRNLKESISITKRAIEKEEQKIAGVNRINNLLPPEIIELVQSRELNQWKKHPHIFFVTGVEKARIIWDNKKKVVAHKYANQITDQETRSKFVKIYNSLNSALNTRDS